MNEQKQNHRLRTDSSRSHPIFPFLNGDVPRSTSYGVQISQRIRFAKAFSHDADFNTHIKVLTQKLLKQGDRYHKLRKTFSKFYRRYLSSKLDLKLGPSINGLVTNGNTKLCCRGFILALFQSTTANKIDSGHTRD